MRVLQILLAALLIMPLSAKSAGYEGWRFGMTPQQVQLQEIPGPYYALSNGDLGTKSFPFRGQPALTSFYFQDSRLARVMIIIYSGQDVDSIKNALEEAAAQITADTGGLELPETPDDQSASLEQVATAWAAHQASLSEGQRFQVGAFPMPADRKIWASITLLSGGAYMVSLNYAEP
ncbi:hypothetical protein [Luteimonas sp. 9C]|uniref:hypothetical protein n=1 Tax=Luteimonas sp. 9C TaxID=2653148 RepID=UPI001357CC14|nr:hypothetical protein [Luteimonas sp. 9C]